MRDIHIYNKGSEPTVALVGNPNVGKSSIFNILTGQNQHTGNWTGKTVENAVGEFIAAEKRFFLVDTPGAYSLNPQSEEEKVTRDFLVERNPDVAVIVCDGELLERNLIFILQILQLKLRTVVCINLIDEVKKRGMCIDLEKLSQMLGTPVIAVSAKKREGIEELKSAIAHACEETPSGSERLKNSDIEELNLRAAEIAKETIKAGEVRRLDRKLDKLFSSPFFGYPVMILMLTLVFWLTITVANYPSQMLATVFLYVETYISEFLRFIGAPELMHNAIVFGIFRVLFSVVSVMLPPMAIFFPLFGLLEEAGILPRIAFNLDRPFALCKACGKQALTMCMGFGCNAAGVMGCRIINSKRERLIAILTNNFVPCNGRFPGIILVISVFFGGSALAGALGLTSAIMLGVFATFFASFMLSKTLLKGESSSYILELPPYRVPDFYRVIVSSFKEKTVALLWRAVKIAAPAGLIIWALANIKIGENSLLGLFSEFLDPLGRAMGLDGVILMAFILGIIANEIVLSLVIMGYSGASSIASVSSMAMMGETLIKNGWTVATAICFIAFSLMHFPCSTTILTIKRETESFKYTLISIIIPTILGIAFCIVLNSIFQITMG